MTRVEIVGTKEEDPDNRCDDSKPDAPGLPGNEALSNVEDAANPEKLAENQRHKYNEVSQKIRAVHNAPNKPQGANSNQRESDHALVSFEESDHRCRLVHETQV